MAFLSSCIDAKRSLSRATPLHALCVSLPSWLFFLKGALGTGGAASEKRGVMAGGTRGVRGVTTEYPGYALQGHSSGVQAVVVLKDRFLISASDDYELRVWDFSASGNFLFFGLLGS